MAHSAQIDAYLVCCGSEGLGRVLNLPTGSVLGPFLRKESQESRRLVSSRAVPGAGIRSRIRRRGGRPGNRGAL